ncbi:hypothetical protein [Arthrobacter sp. H35-D1]|uniref:hypothetical protein n=1 Tax=Arthrobacter sp. H35-D1 TaxID=3046202 RepID=UPI0024B8F65F|nr:hypothetical protein [Arthrobacter sp. H35-D1]MDJ0312368.1 hypothetical protein [Arthrobacter sp. H35-D1]
MSADTRRPQTLAEWEDELTGFADNAAFTGEDVAELPEPVQKYLRAAIRTGTPLAQVLPSALFDDGGVALVGDGNGGFGRHRDAVVGIAAGRKS